MRKAGPFRFDRHFLQGLIAGVLLAAIIGVGVTLIVKPDLFRASAAAEPQATLGGPLLQAPQVVTPQDFDSVVLKSSRQELVLIVDTVEKSPSLDDLVETIDMAWDGGGVKYYYATDAASQDYISKLGAYAAEGPPILAMFYQGKVVARKSLMTDAQSLLVWMNQNRRPKPTPTPTTAPKPEPVRESAVFRAFTTSIRDTFQPAARAEIYLSEVILTAVDFDIDGFVTANTAITAPIASNTALFSLIGNKFGGDSTQFVLPDLSGQVPLGGLSYEIAFKGNFPMADADQPPESHTLGSIKYLAAPISSLRDVQGDLYLGEIVLVRDADGSLGASSDLIPCDGRELQVSPNPALSELLGNRFGGKSGATFKVPDLTGKAPIEGATYYIVIQGLYPSRGDGLPKPTPTTQPVSAPVVYRSFLKSVDDRIKPTAGSGYYLSEVILSAADHAINGFLITNKPSTLPVANSLLFSVIGNSFGGDSTSFVLPGLAGQLPRAGLTYQINGSGALPPKADKSVKSSTVGNIAYLETPIRTLTDVDDRVYLGEIILVKASYGVGGLSRNMVPCDGREVSSFLHPELYSLVGTRFGGTPDKFLIPDLRDVSPIEGARYYFAIKGIVPSKG